ncbi:autotransporter-associated beta strand repeat-containing protein [Pseudopedobacter beijingensis]|uniref:Autotransporter-associated beta strand repeat-containing protein n=1 Tax=Pseudopedobacter beijingensis TaxID=1207056 RepID=A0ABW4I9H8_9SPHI
MSKNSFSDKNSMPAVISHTIIPHFNFMKQFYKSLLLLVVVMVFFVGKLTAQTTETFESYTTGGKPTTFTSAGRSFTLSANDCHANGGGTFGIFIPGQSYQDCDGNSHTSTGAGYGVGASCASATACGGASNNFIDNGASTGVNQIYSIKTTNSSLFTIKSIYVFISTDQGSASSTNGGVTFRGKKAGATVFTLANPTLSVNTNGFTFINFVAAGYGSANIDQLEIQGGAEVNYLALDNFTWDVAAVAVPTFANLNNDVVAWAGVNSTVGLDEASNATISDAEFDALNSGNGNYSGATLTVQRSSTTLSSDVFGFNTTTGALFTVSGANLQSGGLTFATFTNTGGVLTITFTSSGTTATSALVNNIIRRITYRNDTPSGDATIRFTFSHGSSNTTADVAVTSNTIYITNTTDTGVINLSDGVSFSEAVAIAAADATGSQTLVFTSAFSTTVALAGSLTINESLTLNTDAASGMTINGGTTITLGSGTTLTLTGASGTVTIAATLGGSGSLIKEGNGTLVLSSVSNEANMSGGITVNAGTLQITSDDQLSSGTLTLNGGTLTNGTAAFTIDNTIVIGSAGGTFNIGGGSGATQVVLSGVVSGSGTLTKSGTSILELSGNNTYTGSTNVTAGTVVVSQANALGTTAGATTVSAGATVRLAGGLTVAEFFNIAGTGKSVSAVNYGALHLTGGTTTLSGPVMFTGNADISAASGATLTLSGALAGNYTLNKTDAGTLILSNTSNAAGMLGGATVTAGTLSVTSADQLPAGTLTLDGGTLLAGTGTSITFDNAVVIGSSGGTINPGTGTTQLNGAVSGNGTLTKLASGSLYLNTANTFSGGLKVSAGFVAAFNSPLALGTGLITLENGTQLGFATITNGTVPNNIQLNGNATILNGTLAYTIVTLSGVISESGGSRNLTINANNGTNSSITLGGANTYTGTTTIGSGTVGITNASNISAGAIILNGINTIFKITGSGVTLNHNITLSNSATINNANAVTLSGVISGANALTKSGVGTLTLSGTNTYSGSTTVTAGTLAVNSSLGSTTALTVASGATLGGSGSIFANASNNTVTVNNGGALAPGNSPGKLTINGNLTMASGSTFSAEIAGTTAGTNYDQVEVSGNVDITGATLVATHSYTPGNTDVYTIINKTGSGAITGTFSSLAEGATLTAAGNGKLLKASYIGGTGNDMVLSYQNALPVTLVAFTAKADGNDAKLQWQTASEQNNRGFEIWRKTEGLEFVKIGEVRSTINHGLSTINYLFTDKQPLNGNNYYKLVQVDMDGTATELDVRTVNFGLPTSDIRLFPNPTTDRVTIAFTGSYRSLNVSDAMGKILQTQQLNATQKEITLNLSTYPSGIYFVKLVGDNHVETQKVIKKP